MTFQKIFPKIPFEQFINDYFEYSRMLADASVNNFVKKAIHYHLEKAFNLYGDFEMLYDEKYTLDNIEYILINYIPELTSCLLKNDLITSDIFISYTNMQDSYKSENKSSNSYEGLNADSDYMNSSNTSLNITHKPFQTLLMMNQDFKKVIDVIKFDIEKLVQTIY